MPVAFDGELVDLSTDVPDNTEWNKREQHRVRVDTVYWNHLDLPLGETVETAVIGWVGPKRGHLTFWGELSGDDPLVLASYIAAQPRSAFFCPLGGQYSVRIDAFELDAIMASGGDTYWCTYNVEATIVETAQGRIRTGETVSFSYENPPSLDVGQTYAFSGVPAGNSSFRVMKSLGLPEAPCPP